MAQKNEIDTCVTDVENLASCELTEYFCGKRQSFSFDILPKGTEFELAVWRALRSIPYGEKRSYGEIARMIGKEKAARAVGGACHRNPILIVIPCHRVIGSENGNLGGFALGTEMKKILLEDEKAFKY